MDLQKTGALIARARKEKGLTQQQLAKQLHISHTTVSKWERGLGFPEVSLLEPLAAALGLTLDQLFKGEEAPLETVQDEETQPASHHYIKTAVFGLVLLAFVMLCSWSGQVNRKYGGDPTTISGLWQHVPLPNDEEHHLVTFSAQLQPQNGYCLYIDDRLVDTGTWMKHADGIFLMDGDLLDFTAEITWEKNAYAQFVLQLPGLKNPLSMRKRGDVFFQPGQEAYTDQTDYQKLLTGE